MPYGASQTPQCCRRACDLPPCPVQYLRLVLEAKRWYFHCLGLIPARFCATRWRHAALGLWADATQDEEHPQHMNAPAFRDSAKAATAAPATTHEDPHRTCPQCQAVFPPKRTDQRYCGRGCQRKATRNASRGTQKAVGSPAARRTLERRRGRAFLLNDALFRMKPSARPAFLEKIIGAARNHDADLRRILSDWTARRDFDLDYAGRPNLVRTLDDYCQLTRDGARVWQVVAPDWQEAGPIRPLSLYRDPHTPPEDHGDLEALPEVHVQIDPAAFLEGLRRLREAGAINPPSASIEGREGSAR